MSNLFDNSISIYEAMEHINGGKYVMPAFQRQYVWSIEQIEKLWDSILLDYPIATLMFVKQPANLNSPKPSINSENRYTKERCSKIYSERY